MIPAALDVPALHAALALFAEEPSTDTFRSLCGVSWSVAEAVGGVPTLELRQGLLATGLGAGMQDRELRRCIAQSVPGPAEFEPGDSWLASEGANTRATPEQREWLLGQGERQAGEIDHRRMPGVVRSTHDGVAMATTDTIAGFEIVSTLGLVSASAVRTRDIVSKVGSSVRDVVGGEHGTQTGLVEETLQQALLRVAGRASELGANAVTGVRIVSSDVFNGAAEFTVYGTAAVIKPVNAQGSP